MGGFGANWIFAMLFKPNVFEPLDILVTLSGPAELASRTDKRWHKAVQWCKEYSTFPHYIATASLQKCELLPQNKASARNEEDD